MKRGNIFKFINVYIFITFALMIFSCDKPGDDIDVPTGPAPTVASLVNQGWNAYENGEYNEAKDYFEEALNRDVFNKEVYLGYGWTLNRLSSYNGALSKFDLLLSLVTEGDVDYKLLSYVGKAFAYTGQSADSIACIQINKYLSEADSEYVFNHDSRISTENMKRLLANGYWNYQDYYSVQKAVLNYFDQNWINQLKSEGIVSENEVEADIIVEIEVDTTTVPYDTTITSAMIDLNDNQYNLIDVTNITDDTISYPVKRFVHGGNKIYIDTEALDDVSMLLDDLVQPVTVEFLSTQDYGRYLNKLLEKIQSL